MYNNMKNNMCIIDALIKALNEKHNLKIGYVYYRDKHTGSETIKLLGEMGETSYINVEDMGLKDMISSIINHKWFN